jgi:hypothetical protein
MFTFLTLPLAAMLLHPVHESVAEVEWNPQTARLEVALRLSVLDEQWIERKYKSDQPAVWAIDYLRRHVRVGPDTRLTKPADQPAAKYHWVGREQRGSHVWWFFEIEPRGRTRPAVIEQRMLLDRDENYANRVVVLGQEKRQAVTLTVQTPLAKMNL